MEGVVLKLYCTHPGRRSGSEAVYALLSHAVWNIYHIPIPTVAKYPSGKPYFPDRPDIHFSLSHTSTHVLCAISEAAVGADIETVRSVRKGVAGRVCTAEELRAFDFFELWVLKESFVKLSGNTSIPLKNINFGREGSRIITPEDGVTAQLFYDIPGCMAAICSAGMPIPESIDIIAT
jgi:4'-phosphopantetheinyl transferase